MRRTHCKRGHELSPDNVWVAARGARTCKACIKSKATTSRSPEYKAWQAMKERCYYPHRIGYEYYGGRGITVSEEWRDNFEAFYRYVGPRPSPGYTIDRIDAEGNYEPGNVRWLPIADQNRNRRNTRWLCAFGKQQTMRQWAIEYGINPGTLWHRLQKGMAVEQALTQDVGGAHKE